MIKNVFDEWVIVVAVISEALQTLGMCLIGISIFWDFIAYGVKDFVGYNIGWLGRLVICTGWVLILVARRALKKLS